MRPKRIVVLGGAGNFGSRVCCALSREQDLEVIAAGRRASPGPAPVVELDFCRHDFAARLMQLEPHIVIHCAGPFQDQDYRVAEASIAARAHYLDLADARDFVCNFAAAMDASARRHDTLAVCGASSVPALSSAVVDHLAQRFRRVDEIQIVIAPAQTAPRGAATMAAVLSYAGRSFNWLTDGEWRQVRGWRELQRVHLHGLGPRWAAACNVPDLQLFPARYRTVRTVQFRAALESRAQQGALWLLATLRAAGLPLHLERYGRQLDRVAKLHDHRGSARGGMMVVVKGVLVDGASASCEWHLTADDNHGPEVPCMAAILLAKKLVREDVGVRGAYACVGLLSLDEFEPEFARWGMTTRVSETPA
ncbi:MAG TPA: NAD-dependent epimerase/dehydratase family protein [Burkholderiales bacterium]|nr:NAD-dependent epimerase/dehydratase family protein [Burkholderiales bacterium]